MKTSGQAGTNTDVIDDSQILPSAPKGITGVVGVTERGVGPKLVSSWPEYKAYFGGEIPESIFPFLCRRTLEGGGKIVVMPVRHYTDITNPATIVGTKATATKAVAAPVVGVTSKATATFTVTGAAGETGVLSVVTPNGALIIANFLIPATPTVTTVAAAAVAAINAGTSIHGYTATNVAGVVTIAADVALGATPNGYTLTFTASGATAATLTAFASGVTALSINVWALAAETVGAWANNKLWISSVPAANGVANQYDVTLGLDGYENIAGTTVTAKNVPTSPNSSDLLALNAKLRLGKFTSITTIKDFAKTYFTGGAEDKTLITDIDHIGNSSAKLGIYAFDSNREITKIAVPAKAVYMIDNAIANYVILRKDLIGLTRTPVGLDGNDIIDYREGTGSYSHPAIDTWRVWMYTGGLKVQHPDTGEELEITELADVIAAFSKKASNVNEWFAVGGQERGRIANTLGVVYDLGVASRGALADSVSIHGVNAIIDDPDYGVCIWDNMTLQKTDTLLKFANVAELLIYLTRAIAPRVKLKLFNPNDIETWKEIYRNVKYLMEPLKTQRAIWNYRYEGDQDIDDVSQAVVNSPANIDAGAYQFRLFVQPKVGLKFIQIDIVVKNSGIDLANVSEVEA